MGNTGVNTTRARTWIGVAVFAAVANAAALSAQSSAAPAVLPPTADRPIELALLTSNRGVVPGRALPIGLRLRPQPGWHTYWRYAGDVGSAPDIQWRLPAGFRAGPLAWPIPTLISAPPLASYGYENETYLTTLIEVPATARIGSSATIVARVAWVACKVECLAGDVKLALVLPVVQNAPIDSVVTAAFDAARAATPASRPDWTFTASADSLQLALRVSPPRGRSVAGDVLRFFVDTQAVIDHAAPQKVSVTADGVTIGLSRSEYSTALPSRLHGVLVIEDTSTAAKNRSVLRRMGLDVDVPVIAPSTALASQPVSQAPNGDGAVTVVVAILFALIGGTLLNVMPCVLPVLSIKAVQIADSAARDARAARREALFYTAGVILSMWVLVGALLLLHRMGSEIGWGFQLQDPAFVGAVALLMFAAALSMSGVFELRASWSGAISTRVSASSDFGALMNGVLVTALATPCSAPFLASAIAFGLTHGRANTVVVFTTLGIGLSWPILLIAWSPRLRALLPRPGEWMVTIRQLLAFPLYATVAWLTWLVGREADIDALGSVLAALIALAIGLWTYGRFGTPDRMPGVRRLSEVGAVGMAAFALFLVIRTDRSQAMVNVAEAQISPAQLRAQAAEKDLRWEEFTPAKLAAYRSKGRAVLLDFTADWCLTCKVNDKVTFSSDRVRAALAARDVALLRADWTKRDADITRALSTFNRSSVPLVVLYGSQPAGPPVILPTLLTPGALIGALASSAAPAGASSDTLHNSTSFTQ